MNKYFDHLVQFQNRIVSSINLDYGPAQELKDAEPLGIQLEFQGIDNLLAIHLDLSTDTIGIHVSPISESHPKSQRSSRPPFSRLAGQPLKHLFIDYRTSPELVLSSGFPGTAIDLAITSAYLQFQNYQLEVTDALAISEMAKNTINVPDPLRQIF